MNTSFVVSRRDAGQTLAAIVKARLRLSWTSARDLIAARRVRVGRQTCGDPVRRMRVGEEVTVVANQPHSKPRSGQSGTAAKNPRRRPIDPVADHIAVVHCDEAIVVVDKPPGLTTVRHADESREFGPRAGRFLPRTLADHLPGMIPDGGAVRAVHRLDRDTSGLLVFARTAEAERHLGKQFRAHSILRRYLAIVRGRPEGGRIESWLVRDRGDGRRGSGVPGEGQRAVTHVEVLEQLGPCALVTCRLETGRTHQVRIHLGEAGTPLAGERIYDRPMHGAPAADPSGAPRAALHADTLGLKHPVSGKWMEWHSPLPADLQAVLRRLRGSSTSR